MSNEGEISSSAGARVGLDAALPPPGPELGAVDIRKHIQHVLAEKISLELQMAEHRYTLQWLRALHQKAVVRELNDKYQATVVVDEAEGVMSQDAVDGGREDDVSDRKRGGEASAACSADRSAPAVVETRVFNKEFGKGVGRGAGQGRGRSGVRRPTKPGVKAPADVCQACFNERRNVNPCVAHSHGANATACRLAKGPMKAMWVAYCAARSSPNPAEPANPADRAASLDGVSGSAGAGGVASMVAEAKRSPANPVELVGSVHKATLTGSGDASAGSSGDAPVTTGASGAAPVAVDSQQ